MSRSEWQKAVAAALWAAAILASGAGPVQAQPLDLRQPPAGPAAHDGQAGAGLAQAQPGERSRFASFETRLLRLEEELRALTGRVEELEHRNELLLRRLEMLEGRGASGAVPAPPAAAAAPPAVPGSSAESAAAATAGPSVPPPAAAPGEPPSAPAAEAATAQTTPPKAPEVAPQAALEGTADERYRAALALLEAGEFAAAEQALSRFLEDFPDDPRAPTAAFWLGETHFFRQDFATAAAVYARNYRKYGPHAPRAAETLLKLGMSLAALGERERACQTFDELEKRHPDAPAAVRQMLRRERTATGCS